jgi:type I restriction enzyme S subunit
MSSNFNSEVEKLSELCLSIRDGDWIETKDQSSIGYRLIQIGNIGVGKFRESGKPRFVSKETFERLNCTKIEMGDVLIARMPDPTGRAWCVDSELPDSITSVDVAIVRVDPLKLDAKYLSYFLNQESTLRLIASLQTGTTRQRIKRSDLCNLEILALPISTQKTIARTLSNLDLKIALNNHLSKTLENIAQTIFKSWFMDFDPVKAKMAGEAPAGMDAATAALFPDSMSESALGTIPKGWEIRNIGSLCKTLLGGTPSRTKEEYWGGGIPWINSGKVNDFRITSASEYITELGLEKSATKLLPKGTTVLAITGATLGQFSRLEFDACANQSVVGIIGTDDASNEFIFLNIKNGIQRLISAQTGGAQQHINKENVNTFNIIYPGKNLMIAFTNAVQVMFSEISVLLSQNISLAETRDSLLPRLISGELQIAEEMLAS